VHWQQEPKLHSLGGKETQKRVCRAWEFVFALEAKPEKTLVPNWGWLPAASRLPYNLGDEKLSDLQGLLIPAELGRLLIN